MFKYLWGTSKCALCFHDYPIEPQHSVSVCGYVDLDYADDIDNRRSTSGYVFMMFGGDISWMSKWRVVVTLSTIEVKYMEATHACKESIWLKRLHSDAG